MVDSSPFLGVPQSLLTVWSDTVPLSSAMRCSLYGIIHMEAIAEERRTPGKGMKDIFQSMVL